MWRVSCKLISTILNFHPKTPKQKLQSMWPPSHNVTNTECCSSSSRIICVIAMSTCIYHALPKSFALWIWPFKVTEGQIWSRHWEEILCSNFMPIMHHFRVMAVRNLRPEFESVNLKKALKRFSISDLLYSDYYAFHSSFSLSSTHIDTCYGSYVCKFDYNIDQIA